jgi:flagellar hook-associated protein 2
VGQDGRSIDVEGYLWQEYTLPVQTEIKKDTRLEFDLEYTKPEEVPEEDKNIPYRVEFGPKEEVNIKGITLDSYNVSRVRPLEKKKKKKDYDSLVGIGVVSQDKNGNRIEKVYSLEPDAKGRQELPIGKDFAGKKIYNIIFYTNAGKSRFSEAVIATPLDRKGELDPKNTIAKASNARLKVDGVEVEREKNEELDDVIKGLTLTLKRPHERPVEIKIESDIDKAVENIKKFVDAYNKYRDYHRKLVKAELSEGPDKSPLNDRNRIQQKGGLFVGDSTLMRLESTLQKTVSNSYPSRAQEPIKILTQMGISTGSVNADWSTIKEGKLVLDEAKLKEVLAENPEGVEQFFGSDTDGDNRTDNGMAYRMVSVLKPYISFGNNIISSKITLEEKAIESANERIEQQTEHLKAYEERLRQKFSHMEQAISGSKKQSQWLKQQMGGGKGGQGK